MDTEVIWAVMLQAVSERSPKYWGMINVRQETGIEAIFMQFVTALSARFCTTSLEPGADYLHVVTNPPRCLSFTYISLVLSSLLFLDLDRVSTCNECVLI